jgi:hypothetical protein
MARKSFREYITDQEREYNVRVKTIVPIGDDELALIEQVMQKYVIVDFTTPRKTILQKNPLDFYNIHNAEVYIFDITTRLPMSAYVVLQELKLALNIPEKYIVVRSENDPIENYSQQIEAEEQIEDESMKSDLDPSARLSTNSEYDKDERGDLEEPLYGDEFNKNFLETLAQVAADREDRTVHPESDELNDGGTVADAEKLEDARAFNDEIQDAPKPEYSIYAETLKNLRKKKEHAEIGKAKLSTKGNYDDNEVKTSKSYDKYGKDGKKVATVTITNTKPGTRKVY